MAIFAAETTPESVDIVYATTFVIERLSSSDFQVGGLLNGGG